MLSCVRGRVPSKGDGLIVVEHSSEAGGILVRPPAALFVGPVRAGVGTAASILDHVGEKLLQLFRGPDRRPDAHLVAGAGSQIGGQREHRLI